MQRKKMNLKDMQNVVVETGPFAFVGDVQVREEVIVEVVEVENEIEVVDDETLPQVVGVVLSIMFEYDVLVVAIPSAQSLN